MSDSSGQVIPLPERGDRQTCPSCGRDVSRTSGGRFCAHSIDGQKNNPCFMSRQRAPIVGMTDEDHERRAKFVADLAWRGRDEDPRDVWDYLTVFPPDELQRLLVLALAAFPVDQTIEETFAWVCDLPAARAVEAEAR